MLLCAILAVALAVRVGWVAATPHFAPTHDAGDFDRYGVSIARFGHLPFDVIGGRRVPIAYRPPGYPIFLAGVYKVFGLGHHVLAARLVQALTGTATVALIAALGWLLWSPLVGLAAAALAAVYPPLIYVSESMYSEALFVPVGLAAVVAALVFRRSPHRLRWAVAAGVLCGLGVLVRPNAALLALPLALLVWGARRSLKAPALVLVCAALTVAPWTIRNALVLHHFVPVTTELGNTLAGTYNDETRLAPDRPAAWTEPRFTPEYSSYYWMRGFDDATLDHKLRSVAFRYIERHPGYLLEVLRWNTVRMFDLGGLGEERIGADTLGVSPGAADVGTVCFWVLGVLALAGMLTRAARRAPRAVWLLPAAWYVSVIFLNAQPPRFRIAMDPFFIVLAALAVSAAAEAIAARARASNRRRVAPQAI